MDKSQEQLNMSQKNALIRDNLKVALVHDFLTQYGGAERVLEVLAEMYPEAPIYTLLYDQEKMRGKFADKVIIPSFLQKFPKFLKKRYKYLLPLMPTAPETFDLRDFDLVISSSGAWTKGIVTRITTKHICYMHSPMRFAWDANENYLSEQKKSGAVNFFSRLILNYLRVWDKMAADRPDHIIANSKYTQARIKKYYHQESVVIYPPAIQESVTRNQEPGKVENKKYFLVVSRLSHYKNIDKIIEAFNKLELPLMIIGEGGQEKYLRKISGPSVKIMGWQSDEKLKEYYQNARAFVFAGVEDFGMAPVEAMSFGVPVVALRKGGLTEIVIEGKNGEFFDAATPEVIADGIRRFMESEKNYDKRIITERAQEFSKERFIREFKENIKHIIAADGDNRTQ